MNRNERAEATMSIAESSRTNYAPVTFECCDHVEGPFFHGTMVVLDVFED